MAGRRYRLAQRRKVIGLSQERLAEILRVDRSTVVRWERAETDPQPWFRPRLATALKVTVEELAGLLADIGEPPSRPDERLDYVLRYPGRVDLVAVGYLREQVRHLDERYDREASTLLLAQTGQLHGQAVFLATHASGGPVRRELAAAVAESATLMGQLVWDASGRRDHAAARTYFAQTVAAAQQTDDAVTEANALLRTSYLALYGTATPTAGLTLARQAATTSGEHSHIISGLAELHAGEAHAMLGDQPACDQALGAAETRFAAIAADDPAAVLYCPSHHSRLAGSCWLSLDQPGKAEAALSTAHRLIAARRKSTAVVLGNLALAAIRQRHLEQATARMHAAIDVVEATRGGAGLTVVFSAARELRPWRAEPAVQDLNDRLLTLMTAT